MRGIIVSDTSCLILLNKIGKLSILESLFGEVTITSVVAEEFIEPLPDFFTIKTPSSKNSQKLLEGYLDRGEASSIALAMETENVLLIIDELKGRKKAKALNINFTGTLGILIIAKEKGIISSVKEILDSISKTDFRISEKLLSETLQICGEI